MYRSRIRFGNGLIDMAFDAMTGELIELVNTKNGDNLLKNWNELRSMPFSIEVRTKDEKMVVLRPAKYNFLLEYRDLKPKFILNELDTGEKSISISYKSLVSEDKIWNIGVTYTVEIRPGECETIWKIFIKNEETDCVVTSVNFPSVFGVYLGEHWNDDQLVYPFNSGEKIVNPVEAYEKQPSAIGWKWQEYKYVYFMDGINTNQDKDGAFFRQFKYSGPLSMMWLDYYDKNGGLYLACYDEDFMVGGLRAETFGTKRPGMGFGVIKYPEIHYGEAWESPYFGMAIHEGDWHWGADNYRRWRKSCQAPIKPFLPKWFRKSCGMVAHYDFKYQNGEIVHKFSDIPKLYDQVEEMGLNHILVSGWHKDGFDNGFPQYLPDGDLGTEEELINAVKYIRDRGGHVTFYINSQLCNTKYQDRQGLIEEAGVKDLDGNIKTEGYGDSESIVFATMCNNAESWQKHLKDAIFYLIDIIGVDGIYLDQLGMAAPQFCFNGDHKHHPAAWNRGYEKILLDVIQLLRDRKKDEDDMPVIFYEGVTDIHGSYVSGQLISTFIHYHTGAYPELYRYTFPDQILIDMVYPHKGLAMRPVHVGQVSREMIDKAFIMGLYLWIYDLEEDNTFSSDPEQFKYLKDVIKLRKVWLDLYGYGIFKDTMGIDVSDNDITAKLYQLQGGSKLVAISNRKKKACSNIRIYCGRQDVKKVICHYIDNPNNPIETEYEWIQDEEKGFVDIKTTDSELALIYVEVK